MLEFALFPISEVTCGSPTRLVGQTLQVDLDELRNLLQADDRLARVEVELALPGTRTRIIHVQDVVEPRIKVAGGQDYFPGLAAPLYAAGSGRTNVLSGLAVVASTGDIHDAMEGIIDMAGWGAGFSRFARTTNVVLVPTPAEGVDQASFVKALLEAKLKAAVYLARASLGHMPAEVVTREWLRPEPGSSLPKIAYINYLQCRGFGRDQLFYGVPFSVPFPTLVGPTEALDGALVFNGHTLPAKNVTYHLQNNGGIIELLSRQGRDLWLAGTIIANHNSVFAHKERTAMLAARMARDLLGADGVIIVKDGGGQAEVDVMLCCERCEQMGLSTVLLTSEEGGSDGSYPLVHTTPLANAIVSSCSLCETITLDLPMERVIGGDRLIDGQDPQGRIEWTFNGICGATDYQGGLRSGTAVF
ncbi:MAG: beta-aspartyl-peptidase [Chloroflexi bacterium]|nr:beta-aspartyl-peptidase [Chloroflexota bacterium]